MERVEAPKLWSGRTMEWHGPYAVGPRKMIDIIADVLHERGHEVAVMPLPDDRKAVYDFGKVARHAAVGGKKQSSAYPGTLPSSARRQ